ncbi:hypothetical protein ACFOWE_20270 [Planomonospora corallina]|uniref:DUF3558 domain-containing protein n=1 Tax=Planomonospora corallina TaxID=1806052 RepID=A0ABV8IFR2_9ACTN
MPSSAPRRGWLLPAAGVAALALVAGGGAYLVVSKTAGKDSPTPAGSTAPATPVAQSPSGPINPCAVIDQVELDRLVPQAQVSDSTSDNRTSSPAYIDWNCTWSNLNYSYGEYRRSRQLRVKITQNVGKGTETADSIARRDYGFDLQSSQYREANPDKKTYYSPVRKFTGVGDEAHAQYTWSKGENGYALVTGYSRVGDMIIEVEYQASQQPKDVPILSSKGRKFITEQNALREVELLLKQSAESVAAWRQGKPYARSTPKPTPTPSGTPTPVPIDFPATCAAVTPVAEPLVPGAALKSERTQEADRTTVTCRWNNREIPNGKNLRLRSVFVSFITFVNRSGTKDAWAAKQYYIDKRADAKEWEGSGFQGIFWYKVTEPKGLGERAFYQYRKNRTPSAHVGVADAAVLVGSTVIEVSYGGSDRPKGAEINSPKSVLMPQKEVITGLVPVTEAIVASFQKSGIE